MRTKKFIRIATVNVNGIRAAVRKGMLNWLENNAIDILAIQDVRAEKQDFMKFFTQNWHVAYDCSVYKGRAGVLIASQLKPVRVSAALNSLGASMTGRWIEADYILGDKKLTVVCVYVNSGEVDTLKQLDKYRFLDVFYNQSSRLNSKSNYALIVGDFNIAHRNIDIKNWKGNLKHSGFLPQERLYLDKFIGDPKEKDYNNGAGLGWVDIGRKFFGEVNGPYTWWSQRGHAFDNDTGWRIDYQLANLRLSEKLLFYRVDKAPDYYSRWSDHAAVVADYAIFN